ncbi:eotaxin-like [Acipenser ruthenus]|uniref:eotaxin-like n=1 Tax=Acipenser ruthenus TaxID=7906 RepID=UPI002741F754|nr:eotaxin-like [Acipenser ruthenus]
MTKMISYKALLLATLLLALCLQAAKSQPRSVNHSKQICSCKVMKAKVIKAKIESFFLSSGCTRNVVVFTTQRGFRFCAEPEEDWVKKEIQKLSEK